MSKMSNAARSLEKLDELSRRDTFLNRIHPAVKLVVTVLYLVLVVSYGGYQLTGVLGMALYPFLLFEISGLSFRDALRRLRIVLPLVCVVGIFNPLFDRTPVLNVLGIPVSGGVLTMVTLMVKGVLTVLASYLLIASTSVDGVCDALRCLHVPSVIVTEFMLICRYISVLLRETDRLTQAYALRAPGQKGVRFHAWGPMVGQLLLRSMDRAEMIWQSMCIRGYNAHMPLSAYRKMKTADWLYLAGFIAGLALLRVFPVLELAGRMAA